MQKSARSKGARVGFSTENKYFKIITPFDIISAYFPTMHDEYDIEIYEENEFPLAYLLTFRTFGTWLHGDERLSVGRDGRNHFGKPRITHRPALVAAMQKAAHQPQFILSDAMRQVVEIAVKELCDRGDLRFTP